MSFVVCILLGLFSFNSQAGDQTYTNATVTGIGFTSATIDSGRFRFTIDVTDPDKTGGKKVVWLSDEYTGEELKKLYSLVMLAYTSGKPVAYITTVVR